MKIAIVGAGRIGSTFGFHLGRAGHEVTLIARGKRLAELIAKPEIELVDGTRVAVQAAAELDATTPWDLVLVTVMEHQVAPLFSALKASAAKTVLFMFNTFKPLDLYREAVGAERAAFAFPVVIAFFENGKLRGQVKGSGQVTTLSSAEWAAIFAKAGIPTVVEPDMQAWLRSHVAWFVPLMSIGCVVTERGRGITWAEARLYARAMAEGLGVVKQLGHPLIPGIASVLSKLPSLLITFALWAASRTAPLRDLGTMGPGELQHLIDAMSAAAPGKTETLKAIRPG